MISAKFRGKRGVGRPRGMLLAGRKWRSVMACDCVTSYCYMLGLCDFYILGFVTSCCYMLGLCDFYILGLCDFLMLHVGIV